MESKNSQTDWYLDKVWKEVDDTQIREALKEVDRRGVGLLGVEPKGWGEGSAWKANGMFHILVGRPAKKAAKVEFCIPFNK